MMSTQDEILAVLLEQDGQPISGQALADQLGLSGQQSGRLSKACVSKATKLPV